MTISKKQQNAERMRRIKDDINPCKSRLIDIVRKLEEISPRKADQLSRMISRIEDFQNKL